MSAQSDTSERLRWSAHREERPSVSVVMPVHGDQPFLGEQLAALSHQTYDGDLEVLVADNGCTDATLDTVARFKEGVPRLRVVPARSRPGANFARNIGVAAAAGDLIALCDSDDVVSPTWIAALVEAAEDAEMVGGHLEIATLNSPLLQGWRPSPTDNGLPVGHDFLPYAAGSNCAIWRDVYLEIGGCDEEVGGGQGGDDVDLSWRVQLAGGRLVWAPDAVVAYRLRPDLRSMVRQMTAYGAVAALLYRKYRAAGAQRTPVTIIVKYWIRTVQRAPRMLAHPATRGSWIREVAYMVGRLRGAVRHRVIYW